MTPEFSDWVTLTVTVSSSQVKVIEQERESYVSLGSHVTEMLMLLSDPFPDGFETLHQDWPDLAVHALFAKSDTVWLPPLLSKVRDAGLTDNSVFLAQEVTKRQNTMPVRRNNVFFICK